MCTQEVPSPFSEEKSPSASAEKENTSVCERLGLKGVKRNVCTYCEKFGPSPVFVPKTYVLHYHYSLLFFYVCNFQVLAAILVAIYNCTSLIELWILILYIHTLNFLPADA